MIEEAAGRSLLVLVAGLDLRSRASYARRDFPYFWPGGVGASPHGGTGDGFRKIPTAFGDVVDHCAGGSE
jgi:hypothetical protein